MRSMALIGAPARSWLSPEGAGSRDTPGAAKVCGVPATGAVAGPGVAPARGEAAWERKVLRVSSRTVR